MGDKSEKPKRGAHVWDDPRVPKEIRDAYRPILGDKDIDAISPEGVKAVEELRRERIKKAHKELESGFLRLNDEIHKISQIESLKPDAEMGKKFQAGRGKKTKEDTTRYIEKLVKYHPSLSAKKLYKIADESKLNAMALSTFIKKVSIAKNPKNFTG